MIGLQKSGFRRQILQPRGNIMERDNTNWTPDREGAVVVRIECLKEPIIVVEIGNDIYGAVLPNHHEKD